MSTPDDILNALKSAGLPPRNISRRKDCDYYSFVEFFVGTHMCLRITDYPIMKERTVDEAKTGD